MGLQPAFVELDFVPYDSAGERYREIPWLGEELVVVSDDGSVWAGPAAFLICMWALRDWREWACRLSTPALAPLARRFFAAVSSHLHCRAGRCRGIYR
jgi:hypothetical protein